MFQKNRLQLWKEISDHVGKDICCTFLDKDKEELICFLDQENELSCKVHSYHSWCLSDHLLSTESNACPKCNPNAVAQNNQIGFDFRIGIDFGGVIVVKDENMEQGKGKEDTSFFGANWIQTPHEEGVFEEIASLVSAFGPNNVYIVSKCGPSFQKKTLEWLKFHNFLQRTGMLAANVRFVLTRPEKADVAKDLQLTHFVDDRIDVLTHLRKVKCMRRMFLFRPDESCKGNWSYYSPLITKVQKWKQVSTHILEEATNAGVI